jgi:hypothetical protein
MSQVNLSEGGIPPTPSASRRGVFASSDGIYQIDSVGGTTKFAVGGAGGVAIAGGTQTATSGTIVFSNSNGITFGLSGSTRMTASHNGLTTAAASNHSHGDPQLNLTNISGTTASNSAGFTLSLSVAAPGAGGGIAASAGTQAATSGTIVFADSNGLSFGMSGSTQITGSYSQSTHSHSTGPGALAAGTQTATSGTIVFANSNGITWGMSGSSQITASYTVPSTAGLLSAINVSGGTTANNLSAITFANSNGVSFGINGSTLTASHNGLTSQSNQAFSAAGGSSAFQTLGFSDTNGVSFSNSGGSVVATVRTDYASSIHAHNATFFAASNTTQSSSGTVNISSIVFAGAGIASVGVSNGSVVISVPSGGGAGDGGNTLAAGTRTAGSNSVVLFSNANGVTFGLDAAGGSVMTASVAAGAAATVSLWRNQNVENNTTYSSFGQATIHFQRIIPEVNVTFSNLEVYARGSFVSSTNSQVCVYTINYGLYSEGTGASTSLLSQIATSQMVISASYNSNTAGGYTISQGAGSLTSTSAGTALFTNISGPFHLYMPFANSMSAGGKYAAALYMSSNSTGNTGPFRLALLHQTVMNSLSWGRIATSGVQAPSASVYGDRDLAVGSVTTAAMPSSIAYSAMTVAVSRGIIPVQFEV